MIEDETSPSSTAAQHTAKNVTNVYVPKDKSSEQFRLIMFVQRTGSPSSNASFAEWEA